MIERGQAFGRSIESYWMSTSKVVRIWVSAYVCSTRVFSAVAQDFAPWFPIVMRLKRLVWPALRIRHFYSSPGQLDLVTCHLFWYYYVCSIETVLNYLTLFQYYMCMIKMWCLSTAHVVLKYFNTGLLLNISYYINVIIRRFSDCKWQMTSYKKCIGQISTMPLKDTFLTFIQH